MPFSQDIRDEITSIKVYNDDEITSLLSSILMFSGNVVIKGANNISFNIATENESIAKKLIFLFKKMFSIKLELYQKNNYNFSRKKIFVLEYSKHLDEVKEILKKLFVLGEDEQGLIFLRDDIDDSLIENESAVKSFLRGSYMASGSISDPEKSYHLEFVSHNLNFSQNFSKLLNKYNIKSQVMQRKDVYIIYIKESESISDLLNIIGAHKSMFKFEDIRIEKQMRNNINRIVNCETANLSKISKAFVRQKKAIEYIIEKKSIDYLPIDLKEIALLRLENEEVSLKELGEKLSMPITKSSVNHRLNKIEKIAKKIYEEEAKKWLKKR